MIGCAKRIVMAVLLLALLAGAWLFRDQLRTAWHDLRGMEQQELQPSPELAEAAERKLEALRTGESRRVALSGIELESLLRYRFRGLLPAFLDSTNVRLAGDQLELRTRVPVDNLPDLDGLAEAAAFLPDTADLMVAGRLLPLDSGRVAFAVDRVTAAGIPLPGRLVPPALARLGRRPEPDLPDDAMAVRLPAGVTAAYIRADSLVMLSGPAAATGGGAGAGND